MNTKFSQIRWWLIVCLQFLILVLGVFFGIWEHIWQVDITRISFVILVLWLTTTGFIGYYHFVEKISSITAFLPISWFLAEAALALGMIGTVAGFLIMLLSAFANIDVADTASLQTALSGMASGMGTALYTTLTGLVVSLFIKAQLVNLEHQVDQHGKP
jgi:hypothetical protein